MDNLARPASAHADSSQDFAGKLIASILQSGSSATIAPIQKFLNDSKNAKDLRSSVKALRPALIADIAHFLCISHGRHPGIVDHAATKIIDGPARPWLVQAMDGFAAERVYLNNLTVAAGPITRQAGQEKITAIITAQSKSFEMLATSDRKGTAAGAAIAFVLDWTAARVILDECALALSIEPAGLELPDRAACADLAEALGQDKAKQRAMTFGSEQLLAQQIGLWQLIAARHHENMHRS
ncbi:DUF6975 family protein [Sphingorhabdus arenilitoris]|uniref:DUF6975 family protein n=1 Tax=Sphingorhabdus arenilitoris TaxID=1490041 RepID=A0ABV8RHS9_9SPHN